MLFFQNVWYHFGTTTPKSNIMEDKNETGSADGSVSDALFGTSSDAIIEGLHQGIFTGEPVSDPSGQEPGDRNQIVNQQDQQDITNDPVSDEYTKPALTTPQTTTESAAPMSKAEAASILSDGPLDEAGDSEKGTSAKNSEKDNIN